MGVRRSAGETQQGQRDEHGAARRYDWHRAERENGRQSAVREHDPQSAARGKAEHFQTCLPGGKAAPRWRTPEEWPPIRRADALTRPTRFVHDAPMETHDNRLNVARAFPVMARLDRAIGRGTHVMGRGTNHRRMCHRTGGCAVPGGPVEPNHDEEEHCHSFGRLPCRGPPFLGNTQTAGYSATSPISTICSARGPWAPSSSVCSMSAERDGPVTSMTLRGIAPISARSRSQASS